jgi:bifunctional N-acetylglucosamine-1-phosphate-uridyltransferase/glucosamine-1-phosphate-acetyltransferase GlmU-like protein
MSPRRAAAIRLEDFVAWPDGPAFGDTPPWKICVDAVALVRSAIERQPRSYRMLREGIAVHETATIEDGAILKAPCIIGAKCFVAAYAYLRDGVWLGDGVTVGPSVEIKSSLIGPGSSAAHFNFVGNSILGADVNLEAGAILANYRNESADKEIVCAMGGAAIRTGCEKFGALVGDGCRIGANAVLAPGTILPRGAVVPRLTLIDQAEQVAFSGFQKK